MILLMNFLCLDQLFENAYAEMDYESWANRFMLFDSTDQLSRELTALVLNIITLRLYQVYEVLNAKSRTQCEKIDKKIKSWIWYYVNLVIFIRVFLSLFQYLDFKDPTKVAK